MLSDSIQPAERATAKKAAPPAPPIRAEPKDPRKKLRALLIGATVEALLQRSLKGPQANLKSFVPREGGARGCPRRSRSARASCPRDRRRPSAPRRSAPRRHR